MWLTLRSVSSLLVGIAFLMLGGGAISTLLAVTMEQTAFPPRKVGLVMSAYFAGMVIGPFYAHRLIAGVGHIRAFAAFGSLASATALLHPLWIDPWLWGGLRFVQGFCIVGMYMCTESWLNEKTGNDIRGQVFALYQGTVYLCQGAGQLLLNLPDASGFAIYILASVPVSFAVIPVAVIRVDEPRCPEPVPPDLRKLWAISPTGIVGSFAAGTLLGAFYSLGPYFAGQVGLDVAETTQFMCAIIFGGLVLQWPIGKLSDLMDRRTVIVSITIAVAIVCLVIMDKTAGNGTGLMALGALFGGVTFALYPICVAYANDYADPADLVLLSAGLLSACGVGAAVGPLGASLVMDVSGPAGLFQFCALAAGSTAAFTFWRMQQRDAVPVEEQCDFQAMPRTSPVAAEFDSRCDTE